MRSLYIIRFYKWHRNSQLFTAIWEVKIIVWTSIAFAQNVEYLESHFGTPVIKSKIQSNIMPFKVHASFFFKLRRRHHHNMSIRMSDYKSFFTLYVYHCMLYFSSWKNIALSLEHDGLSTFLCIYRAQCDNIKMNVADLVCQCRTSKITWSYLKDKYVRVI